MNIWAYCAADWKEATAHAAGVTPFTAPSHDHETILPHLAKATVADIVYLNLHGFAREPNLFGQAGKVLGPTALTPQLVRQFDWSNVVVFAEVCFSAAGKGSPIAQAFLECGARAFIGSVDEAYGRARPTILDGEADRLMYLFRLAFARVREPAQALKFAKKLLKVASIPLDREDKATLTSFRCLVPGTPS